ncbi:hypothetical protein HR12_42415, partial [Microbacterium sp. SUBG005]
MHRGQLGEHQWRNAQGNQSLVIDTAFSIETADPGHTYDPTGNMIAKAMYETLVDFDGSDVSTPVPGLASWTQNDAATEFTFTLEGDRVFSDGSPIEAKDVVFSLQRIQGMADAKPNFLLGGITIAEVDAKTISFTSQTPAAAARDPRQPRARHPSTPTSCRRTAQRR